MLTCGGGGHFLFYLVTLPTLSTIQNCALKVHGPHGVVIFLMDPYIGVACGACTSGRTPPKKHMLQ